MIIKLYEIIKFQITSFYSNLMKSARTKSSENKMSLEKSYSRLQSWSTNSNLTIHSGAIFSIPLSLLSEYDHSRLRRAVKGHF